MPRNSVLAGGPASQLGLSRCGPLEPGRVDEETPASFSLVFPLTGVFRVEVRGGPVSATPAKVLLFGSGHSQLISHPAGGHDTSAFITLGIATVGPFLDDQGRPPASAAATRPEGDLALRSMLARARLGHLSPLEIESFASETLHLLAGPSGVGEISPDRRRLVHDAEEYLSTHYRSDCDLPTIARAVGSSPHHLSRVFKRATGESLSRRRMRLRLNEAVRKIEEGADDLSRVAVDCGFYDHSHLANSFRTHFGMSPTEMRGRLTRPTRATAPGGTGRP